MRLKKRMKGKDSLLNQKKNRKKAMGLTMTFYYAACLLFAVFVAYTYIKIAYIGAKSTKFNMEYYVNDIGLMTDTIYAVPGDVDYDYRKDPSKFILDFRKGGLYVYTPIETAKSNLDKDNIGVDWSAYVYLSKTENPVVKRFIFPAMLSFKKTGSMLDISSTGIFSKEEYCPDIDTSASIKDINIYFDPGHSKDEPGYESASTKEFELTQRITESLKVLCKSHSLKCTFLQQKNMTEKLKEMNSAKEKPGLIISIHIGKYNNPEDKPFRAMYPLGQEKSEKLACMMGNTFSKDYLVLEPIMADMDRIRQDDYRAILSKSAVSAIFEIGNMNNPKNFAQNSDINEIASSILKGIEEYYSAEQAGGEPETEPGTGVEPQEEPEKNGQGPEQKGNIKAITR